MSFGGSSMKTAEAPKQYVSAQAPEPEKTAEAPTLSETTQNNQDRLRRRSGTSALTIDLNIGGVGNDGRGVNL